MRTIHSVAVRIRVIRVIDVLKQSLFFELFCMFLSSCASHTYKVYVQFESRDLLDILAFLKGALP